MTLPYSGLLWLSLSHMTLPYSGLLWLSLSYIPCLTVAYCDCLSVTWPCLTVAYCDCLSVTWPCLTVAYCGSLSVTWPYNYYDDHLSVTWPSLTYTTNQGSIQSQGSVCQEQNCVNYRNKCHDKLALEGENFHPGRQTTVARADRPQWHGQTDHSSTGRQTTVRRPTLRLFFVKPEIYKLTN